LIISWALVSTASFVKFDVVLFGTCDVEGCGLCPGGFGGGGFGGCCKGSIILHDEVTFIFFLDHFQSKIAEGFHDIFTGFGTHGRMAVAFVIVEDLLLDFLYMIRNTEKALGVQSDLLPRSSTSIDLSQ
jgi:hypothetical protein